MCPSYGLDYRFHMKPSREGTMHLSWERILTRVSAVLTGALKSPYLGLFLPGFCHSLTGRGILLR